MSFDIQTMHKMLNVNMKHWKTTYENDKLNILRNIIMSHDIDKMKMLIPYLM